MRLTTEPMLIMLPPSLRCFTAACVEKLRGNFPAGGSRGRQILLKLSGLTPKEGHTKTEVL